jgi:hypothetical protein
LTCSITNQVIEQVKYLKTIPLEERLVFYLAENGVEQLFHKSVEEAVMAVNPEGVRFINVKDWNMGSPFENEEE